MNTDETNPSADRKNTKEQEAEQDSGLKDAVDVEDLVMKGGYTGDPKEIVSNPAVTPQMIDEPSDLRDDLRRD
ncbi:MAG TPA: hypothetical protein V6D37_11745 [Candidatus Sericytochromatia bacterium]|jgi:hypothetical protein